ncbi:MAG: galactokinase [Armatimonadetes bacterium]|nr:galactokinase [Armatimonadota bacterium]
MYFDAVRSFREKFHVEPEVVSFAPGRVNLIGEHTDYNDGFVFPAAIDRGVWVAMSRCDGSSELWSEEAGGPVRFTSDSLTPGSVTGWGAYPAGVAWSLSDAGTVPDVRAVVLSDLPTGSGLSSSAAIELAFACSWNSLEGFGIPPQELALKCQRAENGFVGMACGVMDQTASALGRRGHALLLDTRSLETDYRPLPEGVSIVVCHTGKSRELAGSKYNERRAECTEAARLLGIPSLREATPNLLAENSQSLPGVILRRALHVVTENQRCLEFAKALGSGDLRHLGDLMSESQMNLRNNYEVSCIELDSMVEAAVRSEGCIGARMTGAGFGGACVALVRTGSVPAFLSDTEARYRAEVPGFEPSFLVTEAADGARTVTDLTFRQEFLGNSGQTISKPPSDMERD